ncbi:MAG: GGDEF domain-containing protein [Candidatus Competibacteraceae bacterium]|nr:GGDEF domain-containing protein [Candidatus Competibacteraceae bacterium]
MISMSDLFSRRVSESPLSSDGIADLAKLMLDLCPDGIILVDQKSISIVFANEQAMLFFQNPELVGSSLPFTLTDQQPQEISLDSGGADPRFVAVKKKEIHWNDAVYWLLSIRDVTARVRLREQLKTESLVDDLTGLLNRRGFVSLGEHALCLAEREKRGLIVVFIDLDAMKQINDLHGHKEGDNALKAIAEVLRKTFRKSDIVARIGGDEFAVVAHGKNAEDKPQIKRRLFENLERAIKESNNSYTLSISVGFADYRERCSLDDLLALADGEMYEEKLGKKKFLQA